MRKKSEEVSSPKGWIIKREFGPSRGGGIVFIVFNVFTAMGHEDFLECMRKEVTKLDHWGHQKTDDEAEEERENN